MQGKSTFLPGETCHRTEEATLFERAGWDGRSQQRSQYWSFFFQEGPNKEKDEYDEQFVG
jgi:hypothetical protein